MDYKKLKIAELQDLLRERGIEFREMARKKELINLLETNDGKLKDKETKIEKIISNSEKQAAKNSLKQEFSRDEIKKIDAVTKDMTKIARHNNNTVDDITLNLALSKNLGLNYKKEIFIKVEKELELKDITINYTDDQLVEDLMQFRNMTFEVGEEEINYNIEQLLQGTGKHQNNDEIKNFLSTINDYPLLSPEKEHEICETIDKYQKKMASGKKLTLIEQEALEDAKEILILSNKRLVISIAKKHLNRGMDLIDLVMEGMLGLEKAIQKFDVDAGFKFSTYATWWIRQGITRGIADKSKVIRVPVHMVETINKVSKAQRELLQQNGQEPTAEEIGKAVKPQMSAEEVEHIFDISRDPIPIEMPVGEDNSALEAFIEDNKNISQDQETEEKQLREILLTLIYELPPQEGDVLLYRYGLYDFNYDDIENLKSMVAYVRQGLEKKRIDTKDAEVIFQLTNRLSAPQKQLVLKRLKQNNAQYNIITNNMKNLQLDEDLTQEERDEMMENAQKQLEKMRVANIKHLEEVLEESDERIDQIKRIEKLTGGVIKPLTLEEVGEVFQVTRERIRQVENKGKRKLKSYAQQRDLNLFIK